MIDTRRPRPLVPAFLVGLGLTLVGVALGLLYIDYVQRGGHWIEKIENPDTELTAAWDNMTMILVALPIGSLGAGLFGAGTVVTFYEFLRPKTPQPPTH